MTTTTGLQIVEAQPKHAPFIAWVMLTAFRSHLEKGFWDFMRPGTDEELLRYLEALTTTKAPHWAHLPLFIVAEVDGKPAAALSGYFEVEHGGTRLRDGMAEADAATGQVPDPEAIGRALTILTVAPEHAPGATVSDIAVFIGNDSAQRAYEKAGYVVVEELTNPEFEAVYKTLGVRTLRRAL